MKSNKKTIRKEFRKQCLKRDEYKCVICGYSPKEESELDVHHIVNRKNMPNGGYVLENGITLCCDKSNNKTDCHLKAEFGEFSEEELFAMIGSNQEKAIQAAKMLDTKKG